MLHVILGLKRPYISQISDLSPRKKGPQPQDISNSCGQPVHRPHKVRKCSCQLMGSKSAVSGTHNNPFFIILAKEQCISTPIKSEMVSPLLPQVHSSHSSPPAAPYLPISPEIMDLGTMLKADFWATAS